MRNSFYISHALAITVFTAFYLFMLWASIDMAGQLQAAIYPTFWTELTEGGLILITILALVLVLMAAHTLFTGGSQSAKVEMQDKACLFSPRAKLLSS